MALTNYLADNLLDHVLLGATYTAPADVYLALFTVLPAADGTGGTEVTGGSYARQSVAFSAAVNGVAMNSAYVGFTAMPAATVVGSGLYDASTAGNLLMYGPFSTATLVQATADFNVPVGDVVAVFR
jgi:hypothetical protein